jgi:hypothetical protein
VLALDGRDRLHRVGVPDRRRGGFGEAEVLDLPFLDEFLHRPRHVLKPHPGRSVARGVLGQIVGLQATLALGALGALGLLLPVVWLCLSPVRGLRTIDAPEQR